MKLLTPWTVAGRRLADRAAALWWQPNPLAGANAMQSATSDVRADILAIEQEAALLAAPAPGGLDVERLARAMVIEQVDVAGMGRFGAVDVAERVAVEYARLAGEEPE